MVQELMWIWIKIGQIQSFLYLPTEDFPYQVMGQEMVTHVCSLGNHDRTHVPGKVSHAGLPGKGQAGSLQMMKLDVGPPSFLSTPFNCSFN